MKRILLMTLSLPAFFSACNPKVEAINFGSDQCSFCRMSIADNRYGAEIVTEKGKVFKYDAIECMIRALCANDGNEATYLHSVYTINYLNPGELIEARQCYFLRSEALPSPMGAFLTSLSDSLNASILRQEHGGEIYDWKNVVLKVKGGATCDYEI